MGKAVEMLETLLDYNGSVHSSRNSYGNFSPSNIKTLVISQDGFCGLMHLPSLCSRKTLYKQGVALALNEDYSELNRTGRVNSYKPLYKVVLGTEGGNYSRVYSAIEEIIFLKQGANNFPVVQNFFEAYELGSINEGVKNEFKAKCKRLRRISVVNTDFLNFTKFLSMVYLKNKEMRGSSELLSVYLEKQFGQAIMSIEFNTDDWYKQIRTGVAQYKTYSVEGDITNHFQEVFNKEEARIKRLAMAKMRKEKDEEEKKVDENTVKLVKVYEASYLAYRTLTQEIDDNSNMLYDETKDRGTFYFKPIPKCGVDSKVIKVDESIDTSIGDIVPKVLSDCLGWLSSYYIDLLYNIMLKSPVAFKVLMGNLDDADLKVMITKASSSKVVELERASGKKFQSWGRNLRIPSMCCTICKIFTNIDSEKEDERYWYSLSCKRGKERLEHGNS